jgi:alpha-amylase
MLPAFDVSPVPIADPGSPLPAGWEHGVFMQIFVRGYRDSDGDGIGDLRGVIDRLDYLAALGVQGLWLMPITDSQDHDHGYAVTDYRGVEAAYGDLADVDALIAAAHARGIGVIIDYVMNHSAAQHPAFVNSQASDDGPFRSWYVWEAQRPSGWTIYGSDPWRYSLSSSSGFYFAGFWDQMPDFNLRNLDVLAWHQDNLRFWLNRGVDGFRFDAVGNLIENGAASWENQPENHPIMGQVRALLGQYRQRFMVCEAPAAPAEYAAATSCGSAFAFGRQHEFVAAARGDAGALAAVAEHLRSGAAGLVAFASNHDSFAGDRLFDQVGGDLAQYRLAAATYLLQRGAAFIYYGEEIGMAGAASLQGDPRLRTPMSWTGDSSNGGFSTAKPFRVPSSNVATFNVASQLDDPDSLLAFYRSLLALRKQLPALVEGASEQVTVDGSVLHFRRSLGGEHALVAINYGAVAGTPALTGLPRNSDLTVRYPAGAAPVRVDGQGRASLSLPAQQLTVLSYRD